MQHNFTGADPGFSRWGRGCPTPIRVFSDENVCENERIGSHLRGEGNSPRSANISYQIHATIWKSSVTLQDPILQILHHFFISFYTENNFYMSIWNLPPAMTIPDRITAVTSQVLLNILPSGFILHHYPCSVTPPLESRQGRSGH